jgi:hypothetical protein
MRSDSEDGNGGVFIGRWAGVGMRSKVAIRRRYVPIYGDRGWDGVGRGHRYLCYACLRVGEFGMLMRTARRILVGRFLMMAAAGRGFRGTAGVGCTIAEAVGIRKQRSDCNQDKRATTAKKHDLPLTYQMIFMVRKLLVGPARSSPMLTWIVRQTSSPGSISPISER